MRVQIESIERLNLSVNGNPRFRIHYSYVGLGTHYASAITSSDHAFCYEVGNPGLRAGDTVDLTFTRAGRISGMKRVETVDA